MFHQFYFRETLRIGEHPIYSESHSLDKTLIKYNPNFIYFNTCFRFKASSIPGSEPPI